MVVPARFVLLDGIVDHLVVAVPANVGYAASFGSVPALLPKLNSCAPGIVVVNIDNGSGAGYAASQMIRKRGVKNEP